MKRSYSQFVPIVGLLLLIAACGPIKPPKNAYQDADTLLSEMEKLRAPIQSFRIAGSIDHVQEQRIRGKAYMFAKLPDNLRIDILSPFGNTLSVLTADKEKFGLSDYKSGRFFNGAPKPCNVARFVGVALPPKDVITIMVGKVPIINGEKEISWHPDGHYVVTITNRDLVQVLHIGADKKTLPLISATLTDKGEKAFDISYDMWRFVSDLYVPFEIRIQMPKDKAELFVQYEENGVELNVDLPKDAWDQTVPAGAKVEPLTCE